MTSHVIAGDAISDALITQRLDQPIEQASGIMPLNRGGETVLAASSTVNEKLGLSRQATDTVHEIDGVVAIGAAELLVQGQCHTEI
jgi:hypothetical protein